MKNFNEIISQIPKSPGTYIYKNVEKTIIYIGKASNLYNRVRSYFNKNTDIKTKTLVSKIDSIEYIVTNNEVEALLLENNLIKQYQPKYNIKLKDSKSYPFIKITKENLSKAVSTRENKNKTDEYFGPFTDTNNVRTILTIFRKYLKIRSCKKKFKPPYNYKPCLNYHIGRCLAPCAGKISEEDYNKNVDIAKSILNGKTKEIIETLTKKMQNFSENMEFEKAALLRDQIAIIKEFSDKQIVDNSNGENSDYVGFYSDYKTAAFSVLKQRGGKI
ncbi:MAG TPA: excinuclease ABC subunit UvrC, partial [Spirochaetota bacterium]|nr:excinuclease ABC subunit UvrC [Spirochaetota bacterium]